MKRCKLDKIASVTARLGLDSSVVLGKEVPAEAGTVLAGRVLNAKTRYNTLEDVHGRMVALHPGDVIAGALGHRDALYGYSGRVPDKVEPGDVLDVLNLGGVIGAGASGTPELGDPFRVEVLGSVLEFPYVAARVGHPARVSRAALAREPLPARVPPIVILVGTCMDSGKTTAASVLIAEMSRAGKRVAAGKLTGVSLRRDILEMSDCGADPVAIFTDFGVVTTDESNSVDTAHALVAYLAEAEPDVILLEMGDGMFGTYGVRSLLSDPALKGAFGAVVLCAQDPVGAWGGERVLREQFGVATDVICGRVSDSRVGVRFCEDTVGVPAWNALRDGDRLAARVAEVLATKEAQSCQP